MRKLVFHAEVGVIRSVGLPHFPDDFEPAPAKAAQGFGIAFASLPQRFIILRGPGGLSSILIGKEIHRVR